MGRFTYKALTEQLEAARVHFQGMAATADTTENGAWQQADDALAEALDIIFDYQKQGDRLSELEKRERVFPPERRCGAHVCRRCGRRTNPAHTYCHYCGQRQRKEGGPWKKEGNSTQGRK